MSHLPKKLKIAVSVGKGLLALAFLVYLIATIQKDSGFTRLLHEPKQWPYILLALGMVLVAFSNSFVRWYLLVRGLDLDFQLRDAFRLGSLGFMLSQVMPGSVGGDLFRAAFIAHEQPGRRTLAVASVFIDRVVGLVAMLVVASLGLIVAGKTVQMGPLIRSLQTFVWLATVGGIGALLVMASPLASGEKVQSCLQKIPGVGHLLHQLSAGLANFRSRRRYLVAAFILAILTHSLLVGAFWCLGRGLPIDEPTFPQTVSIVPLAFVAGGLPLTPGGLGLFESGLAKLFGTIGLQESDGAMVALGYRALTYAMAVIGACYYFTAKKRYDELLIEAESLAGEVE